MRHAGSPAIVMRRAAVACYGRALEDDGKGSYLSSRALPGGGVRSLRRRRRRPGCRMAGGATIPAFAGGTDLLELKNNRGRKPSRCPRT